MSKLPRREGRKLERKRHSLSISLVRSEARVVDGRKAMALTFSDGTTEVWVSVVGDQRADVRLAAYTDRHGKTTTYRIGR
jgi:hypothetical protein